LLLKLLLDLLDLLLRLLHGHLLLLHLGICGTSRLLGLLRANPLLLLGLDACLRLLGCGLGRLLELLHLLLRLLELLLKLLLECRIDPEKLRQQLNMFPWSKCPLRVLPIKRRPVN